MKQRIRFSILLLFLFSGLASIKAQNLTVGTTNFSPPVIYTTSPTQNTWINTNPSSGPTVINYGNTAPVGIGALPVAGQQKLQIGGKTFIDAPVVGSSDVGLRINSYDNSGLLVNTNHLIDYRDGVRVNVTRDNTFGFRLFYMPTNEAVFSVKGSGNAYVKKSLGIGTSATMDGSTFYRLSVCGKIRAHELKVYTSWCDYVFEDDYELLPLDEVRSFIQENHHLPGVPAGNVVEEEGLMVGEMQAVHMKKIEELTLYLLELDQQVKDLKADNEILRGQLKLKSQGR